MKRGRKPIAPSEKVARGTLQPSRDAGKVELVEPNSLPQRPDWLTAAGEEIWIEEAGRVMANRLVGEKDSTMFANYCNLQGAIVLAWRAGTVPPVAALMEARKMAEQFGIFGARSRVKMGGPPSGPVANPFARNGRQG